MTSHRTSPNPLREVSRLPWNANNWWTLTAVASADEFGLFTSNAQYHRKPINSLCPSVALLLDYNNCYFTLNSPSWTNTTPTTSNFEFTPIWNTRARPYVRLHVSYKPSITNLLNGNKWALGLSMYELRPEYYYTELNRSWLSVNICSS